MSTSLMPPITGIDPGAESDEDRRKRAAQIVAMPPAVARPAQPSNQPASPSAMPPVSSAPPSRSQASAVPSAMPPVQQIALQQTPPTPTAVPPAGRAEMAGPSPSQPNAMPPVQAGPAQQRFQDLAKQGPPQPKMWQRALEIAGSVAPFGLAIEKQLPGTPIGYNAALNKAGIAAAKEQSIAGTQAEQQRAAAGEQRAEETAQFNTPEKRRAYMAAHPDEFEGVSDFQKNDFVLAGKFPQREPPADQMGKTPEETTIHDLMTGESGGPRVNPDTGKPYTYLEAYSAVKDAAQGAKPGKHSPGEVKYDEGIPTGIYGEKDKLYRSGDATMPDELKAALADANNAHKTAFGEKRDLQREGRSVIAGSRASTFIMPDGTMRSVNGDELPQFMKENPQAVQTTPGATVQAMGRQALISDIRRAANNVRGNLNVLDGGLFDRAKLAASLADPNSTPGQFFQAYPRAAEDERAQQFISDLYSLREQAMAMRSVLGAGQGSEDLRRAILQTLPGVGSPSSGFGEKQINNLLQALETLEKGVPKAPQRGGESKDYGAAPQGRKEGDTGTMKVDGKDVKVVVRNGRITPQ